jgi:hypothetical protein
MALLRLILLSFRTRFVEDIKLFAFSFNIWTAGVTSLAVFRPKKKEKHSPSVFSLGFLLTLRLSLLIYVFIMFFSLFSFIDV